MGSDQSNSSSVSVSIYDMHYHLRGPNVEYIRELAQIVDAKMHGVAANGKTVDSLRVAVLAALNIADELRQLQMKLAKLENREAGTTVQQELRSRTESLNTLLDEILDDREVS